MSWREHRRRWQHRWVALCRVPSQAVTGCLRAREQSFRAQVHQRRRSGGELRNSIAAFAPLEAEEATTEAHKYWRHPTSACACAASTPRAHDAHARCLTTSSPHARRPLQHPHRHRPPDLDALSAVPTTTNLEAADNNNGGQAAAIPTAQARTTTWITRTFVMETSTTAPSLFPQRCLGHRVNNMLLHSGMPRSTTGAWTLSSSVGIPTSGAE